MKLKLIKKQNEAKGTKSFFWEPEKNIDWYPGQYFYYTLPKLKYDDTRGPTRQFTMSSSPTEKGILRLTTRFPQNMSGFKKTLLSLKTGSVIDGDGPSGMLKFNEDQKDNYHVFLAGGVGITPFRSLIKYNIDKKLFTNMHLIYSNSSPDEITFDNEIKGWTKNYDFLQTDLIITKPKNKKLKGNTSRINYDLVKMLTKGQVAKNTSFWAVGPSKFVYAMEDIIDKFRIMPENKHIEIFTGY